jgi:hypothetical protein
MNRDLMQFLLRALLRAGDYGLPESSLCAAARLALQRLQPTDDTVRRHLEHLKGEGFCLVTEDEITGPTWVLTTPKGIARASQLG